MQYVLDISGIGAIEAQRRTVQKQASELLEVTPHSHSLHLRTKIELGLADFISHNVSNKWLQKVVSDKIVSRLFATFNCDNTLTVLWGR